ncbi:MAG: hypothetical protein R3F37_07905 [Candidatus Competibacteraceae bacterium]
MDVLKDAAQQFSDPRQGAAMSRLAERARQRRGELISQLPLAQFCMVS